MATLSVHPAVINLLPPPALDGGLLIHILSGGIRVAFEPETLGTSQALADLCLSALIVVVTENDIVTLLGIR